jgi:hypothetical protein
LSKLVIPIAIALRLPARTALAVAIRGECPMSALGRHMSTLLDRFKRVMLSTKKLTLLHLVQKAHLGEIRPPTT